MSPYGISLSHHNTQTAVLMLLEEVMRAIQITAHKTYKLCSHNASKRYPPSYSTTVLFTVRLLHPTEKSSLLYLFEKILISWNVN